MCDPFTQAAIAITSVVVSAVGTAVSTAAASANAKAQAKYQTQVMQARNKQILENSRLAQANYIQQQTQENFRQQEEDVKASQQIQQYTLQARQQAATDRVSSGESGVAGLSVDALQAEYDHATSLYRDSVSQNREWSRTQSQMNQKGYEAQAKGNIAAIQPYIPEPVPRPSWLGAALKIGGDALEGAQKISGFFPKSSSLNPKGG